VFVAVAEPGADVVLTSLDSSGALTVVYSGVTWATPPSPVPDVITVEAYLLPSGVASVAAEGTPAQLLLPEAFIQTTLLTTGLRPWLSSRGNLVGNFAVDGVALLRWQRASSLLLRGGNVSEATLTAEPLVSVTGYVQVGLQDSSGALRRASSAPFIVQPAALGIVALTSPPVGALLSFGQPVTVSASATGAPAGSRIEFDLLVFDEGSTSGGKLHSATLGSVSVADGTVATVSLPWTPLLSGLTLCSSTAGSSSDSGQYILRATLISAAGRASTEQRVWLGQPLRLFPASLSILPSVVATCESVLVEWDPSLVPEGEADVSFLIGDVDAAGLPTPGAVTAVLATAVSTAAGSIRLPSGCCDNGGNLSWVGVDSAGESAVFAGIACLAVSGRLRTLLVVTGATGGTSPARSSASGGTCAFRPALATSSTLAIQPALLPSLVVLAPAAGATLAPGEALFLSWLAMPGTGSWRVDAAEAITSSGVAIALSTLQPSVDGSGLLLPAETLMVELSPLTTLVQSDGSALMTASWTPSTTFPWSTLAGSSTLQRVAQLCVAFASPLGGTYEACASSPPFFVLRPTDLSLVAVGDVDVGTAVTAGSSAAVSLRPGSAYNVSWRSSNSASIGLYLLPPGARSVRDLGVVTLLPPALSPLQWAIVPLPLFLDRRVGASPGTLWTFHAAASDGSAASAVDCKQVPCGVLSAPAFTPLIALEAVDGIPTPAEGPGAQMRLTLPQQVVATVAVSPSLAASIADAASQSSLVLNIGLFAAVNTTSSSGLVTAVPSGAALVVLSGSFDSMDAPTNATLSDFISMDFALPASTFAGAYVLYFTAVDLPRLAVASAVMWVDAPRSLSATIVPPSSASTTTAPFFDPGDVLQARWTSVGITSSALISIVLLRGSSVVLLLAGGAANDPPSSFNLPLTLPSGESWPDLGVETDSSAAPYALCVCASTPGLPSVCSTTSAFGIRKLRRFVAVTQPDSASVWTAGQSVTVRWASSSIPSTATVSISLMSYRYELQGGDVQLASIGAGLPVLNGLSMPWTVPAHLPSTSPVYIKVAVNGQGVWGRSPVFLLKSAPLPVLSEFLSAACPRDSSQPALVFLCRTSRTTCLTRTTAAAAGVWTTLATASLSFSRTGMDEVSSTGLSDAGFEQLSSIAGAFSTDGSLSLCLPPSGAGGGVRTLLSNVRLGYLDTLGAALVAAPNAATPFAGPTARLVVVAGLLYTRLETPLVSVVQVPLSLPCAISEGGTVSAAACAFAAAARLPCLSASIRAVTNLRTSVTASAGCSSGTSRRMLATGGASEPAVLVVIPNVTSSSAAGASALASLLQSGDTATTVATAMGAQISVTGIAVAISAAVQSDGGAASGAAATRVSADLSTALAGAQARPLGGPDASVLSSTSLTDGSANFRSTTAASRSTSSSLGKISPRLFLYSALSRLAAFLAIPVWAAAVIALFTFLLFVGGGIALCLRQRALRVAGARKALSAKPAKRAGGDDFVTSKNLATTVMQNPMLPRSLPRSQSGRGRVPYLPPAALGPAHAAAVDKQASLRLPQPIPRPVSRGRVSHLPLPQVPLAVVVAAPPVLTGTVGAAQSVVVVSPRSDAANPALPKALASPRSISRRSFSREQSGRGRVPFLPVPPQGADASQLTPTPSANASVDSPQPATTPSADASADSSLPVPTSPSEVSVGLSVTARAVKLRRSASANASTRFSAAPEGKGMTRQGGKH